MADFSKILTGWYLQHKRDLPWRNTTDPYLIWLSEIMLQQTRVAQGLPYYLTFVEHFPAVADLAKADEQKVLRLWQGLGYYSRARNLHKTARQIAFAADGIFPDNYKDLLKLKGIGDYTAAAIASFSYNEAVPVVDGNVFRVLSRYFDIETDIANPSAKKEFAALAFELMPNDNPALFNQAIMEFGALQCVPKNPDCSVCPFNDSCLALKYNKVNVLPVKSKKAKVKSRFLTYLVYEDEVGQTKIVQRTGKGIWENLYEFPVIETDREAVVSEIDASAEYGNEIISMTELVSDSVRHKLSHQHLNIRFVKMKVKGEIFGGVPILDLHTFPFPIVLHNFIQSHWK
ncbi:MAG: A/G-specific adenine glycosylase [Flavobacterium sp.]|nr:MAG: A/G-specific adenine glycosylase [Flavobacterium sp.]